MAELGVSTDPNVMGGIPVFSGTRVPVQPLLDYLEGGETFLEGLPSVARAQVLEYLERSEKRR
jgi:uncharacterized protein (DUF433 family)